MTLSHPASFAIGVILTFVTSILVYRRGVHSWLMLCGLLLLCLAAAGPSVILHPAKRITVMVDLSPSTRGAAYRDRATLLRRIGELAGKLPFKVVAFSDHLHELPSGSALPDLPCEQTQYDPPPADAILLFSDGRFALPDVAATTYPVIDPFLIDPPDAAVTQIQTDGKTVTATVQNRGMLRQLSLSGAKPKNLITVGNGSTVFHNADPVGPLASARLNAGDLWPENDSLSLVIPPPLKLGHWWIGDKLPPDGWMLLTPSQLPTDPVEYLDAAAIAISNVSASELSETQQQRLSEYVRDLGGSLLIFGGDRAFSAGGYGGTTLDSLSPLSSDPPSPTTHWILLADSSGSMAELLNGRSRWSAAVDAMLRLLPSIPATDVISVGSFARDLSWWVDAQPASVAAKLTAPPVGVFPYGPTNLQPILAQLAARKDSLPVQVILVTDADTTIDDPQLLAASLKAASVRVSLLALSDLSQTNPVVQVVNATGGHWSASEDPKQWIDSLRRLMHAASSSHLENMPVAVRFTTAFNLPNRSLNSWNHTWVKTNAEQLATVAGVTPVVTLGAYWQLGLGNVGAFAFAPSESETDVLATNGVTVPRDPRFKVSWQFERAIKVTVNAVDQSGYLNGFKFLLNIGGQPTQRLQQISSGRYALKIPAIKNNSFATLLLGGHIIDRRAISGRYSPEFDAVGIDNNAVSQLAALSGGHVIAPSQHTPIAFGWPATVSRVDSYVAIAAALLLALAFIRLHRPTR